MIIWLVASPTLSVPRTAAHTHTQGSSRRKKRGVLVPKSKIERPHFQIGRYPHSTSSGVKFIEARNTHAQERKTRTGHKSQGRRRLRLNSSFTIFYAHRKEWKRKKMFNVKFHGCAEEEKGEEEEKKKVKKTKAKAKSKILAFTHSAADVIDSTRTRRASKPSRVSAA